MRAATNSSVQQPQSSVLAYMRLACLAEGSQSLPHILEGLLEESLTLQIIDMQFPAFSGLNLVEKSVFLIQENVAYVQVLTYLAPNTYKQSY